MAISAVASRASTELPYSWRSIALGGGGFVTGVVYHLNAPGLVYARTDVGGAYRWDGPTSRWVALNDDLGRDDAQLTGVVSLAVDPHDPDRLYLACGQYLPSWGRTGAVLRSVDRGATWQRTELSIRFGGNADGRSTGERLQVDPHEGRILFLGSHQDGLWRSADRGVTWTRVAGFSGTHVTFVLPDRRSGNLNTATTTWYAGTAAAGGGNLWRSTDGGSTWNAVPGQPAGLIPHHADFDYRDDGKLYLAYSNGLGPNGVTAGAVWKLDPSTGGWTQLPVPTGQGGFAGVSVDAQRAGVVVVSTLNRWAPGDEVYRTTDGGATWRPLLSGSTYDRSAGPWSVARSPHWIGDVDINPHNSDEAMFITGYGIWATSNLTASEQNQSPQWSFRNQELEETVPLDLVSPPQGAPLIVAYGDIGVFRHADPRVTPPLSDYFATHRTTTRSLAIAAQAPQILARLHHDGTRGAYTLDGGLTHHDFATAPSTAATNGPGAIAVSADGARFLWMPERSVAYVSSNRGGSWTASAGGPGGGTTSLRPAADAVDANTFYIYDSVAGRVAVSRDGGVSFSAGATGLPSGGAWLKAVPGRAGQVWLPAEAGGLYRSIDYGATFTKLAAVQAGWRLGFGRSATDGGPPAAYLWGRIGGVEGFFRSDDEGTTWLRINDDAHRFGWINDIVGDSQTYGRVYLATGGRGVVFGEPAVVGPTVSAFGWAAFTVGDNGSYTATATDDPNTTWLAEGLPAWASFDPLLGRITGVPTEGAGTLHQVRLRTAGSAADSGQLLNLFLVAAGDDVGLSNLSARSAVGTGASIVIAGAAVRGNGGRVLVRAAGPALKEFELSGTLDQPELTLFRGNTPVATNRGWANGGVSAADLRAAMASVGAFSWPDETSADSALLTDVAADNYSAQVSGVADATGVALVELYDAAVPRQRPFVNLSFRAVAGTGEKLLIGGFVMEGNGSRRCLIRAIGPTLSQFGVSGVLSDPRLTLFRDQTELARNDNWSASTSEVAALQATMVEAGAFALPLGSADAVLMTELGAGHYSAHVAGADGGTGVALLEVYVLR